jgi:hypothetical protein
MYEGKFPEAMNQEPPMDKSRLKEMIENDKRRMERQPRNGEA